MITHFLGKEEVAGYARDLVARLQALGEDFPTVWCPLGKSGDKLLRELQAMLPAALAQQVKVVELFFDKTAGQVQLGASAVPADLSGAKALILDSSVHSGKSMLAASRLVRELGARGAIAYSMIVKRTSGFLPHYFGVMVGDHDRVLFQLEDIPNNRLFAGPYLPLGTFRRIEPQDAQRPTQRLDTGVASIDKISLGDLYYEHKVNSFDVVLVEESADIAAFLKMRITPRRGLLVDVIANDKAYRGRGLGGALMRYAETVGRSSRCTHIELWAIEGMAGFYEQFGYVRAGDRIDAGGGEVYELMRRPLLYHFDLRDFE